MAPRVYSAALAVGRVLNNANDWVYRVPAGHRWVVKSLTWCEERPSPAGAGTYGILVLADYPNTRDGALRMVVIEDRKLDYKRPGEWEGRLTLHEDDALVIVNTYAPYDSNYPILVTVSGYDFLG